MRHNCVSHSRTSAGARGSKAPVLFETRALDQEEPDSSPAPIRAEQLQLIRLPDSSASRDWVSGKRCLVAGLGPIGLLAALALRLRGAEVWGLDVVDANTVRPRWLNLIGGHYLDGREVKPNHLIDQIELFDLIFEAAGIASLEFDLIDALAINGVYVVTGIPSGDRALKIDGAEFMRRLVLRNQVVLGSVNASHDHFQLAVNDLVQAQKRWHEHVADLITHRHNYTEFESAFQHHGSDEIKVVLEWSSDQVSPKEKVNQLSYHEA